MKSTINPKLSCAVFGHNFIKSKTKKDNTSELLCKHCNVVITTDSHGNFEESAIPNKTIQSTIRQLFSLKHRFTSTSLSS